MADVAGIPSVGGGAAGSTAGIFAVCDCGRARLPERFSAGGASRAADVRTESARQLVTSAGDEAIAAPAAVQYLRDGRGPDQ